MGVVAPRPDEKRRHQEAVVEVVDRPHLVQLVEVGAVEALARVVVAEEGADLFHSFLAEVVGDLLCSIVVLEDLRSVTVVAEVVEVADMAHTFREVVAAVGVLVSILHLFQGVVEVVVNLYNLEEEAVEVEVELQY